MNLYQVLARTGPRKTVSVGLYTSKEVATYVASLAPNREVTETTACTDSTVTEFTERARTERLALLRSTMSPEDLALLQSMPAQST